MLILVLLQGDIGQTLLIMIIIVSMFIFAGIGVQKLVRGPVLLIAGSFIMIASLFIVSGMMPHYLKARFSTLMNPFSSEAGTGYHLTNSLMAIGNGGLFGRGLGNGIMKLGYLPEAHTDFIFAVICEELGLVGGLFVICLLFFIVYRAFVLATKTPSYFYKLICVGVASYIGSQTFVNLGGISKNDSINWCTSTIYKFWWFIYVEFKYRNGSSIISRKTNKIDENDHKS